MYHIRLKKGLSYSGAVTATRRDPDVFTEDAEIYASAMASGYFADLTGSEAGKNLEEPDPQEEDDGAARDETGAREADEEDALASLSVEELKAYAELNGIDLSGAKKKAEILALIREAETRAAEARNVLRGQ